MKIKWEKICQNDSTTKTLYVSENENNNLQKQN